jgi:hypothetical protein
VTAGTRTFKWKYSKDGSISKSYDSAWIDDIVFPLDDGGLNGSESKVGVEETFTQDRLSN